MFFIEGSKFFFPFRRLKLFGSWDQRFLSDSFLLDVSFKDVSEVTSIDSFELCMVSIGFSGEVTDHVE